jgi:PAS domain S-box-containing protein
VCTGDRLILMQCQSGEVVVEVADLAPSNKKTAIHVLHVDDDPSLQELTKLMLLDLDSSFEIDNACCVDEALKKLAAGHYDIVISDYDMPQKNGLELLKELHDEKTKVPFILFTGKGREEIAIEALNLGAEGYHNKQGSPETVYGELSHSVKSIVAHSKAKLALIESQLSTRSIIDSTIDMIWSVNCSDFGLMAFNQSFETYFLKERGIEIKVGDCPEVLFPTEEFVEKWHGFYERALKEGSFTTEYEVYSGKRILQLTFNAIRHESQLFGVSVFGKDITEKRQAEDACRESQSALEESQRIACLGTWILDIPAGVFRTSDLMDEIFGIDKTYDHSVKGWASMIHPDDRAMMVDYLQNDVIGRRKPCDKEFRIVRVNDKATRWLLAIGRLEYDVKGHPIVLQGTSQDITDRKFAQEEIRKSEEKYRQLVECSTDGIFTIDLSAKVNWVNAYGLKLLGYCESDLPISLLKVIPARYLLKAMRLFSEGLRGKVVTAPFDLEVLTKGRERIPVSYRGTLLHDEKGKVTGVLGIIRDFHEKKQMEENSWDIEEQLHFVINVAPVVLWEIDGKGIFTLMEGSALSQVGLHAGELVGQSVFEVYKNEPALIECIQRGLAGETFVADVQAMGKYWSTHYVPHQDKNETVTNLVITAVEITEHKKVEVITKEEIR